MACVRVTMADEVEVLIRDESNGKINLRLFTGRKYSEPIELESSSKLLSLRDALVAACEGLRIANVGVKA